MCFKETWSTINDIIKRSDSKQLLPDYLFINNEKVSIWISKKKFNGACCFGNSRWNKFRIAQGTYTHCHILGSVQSF